MPDPQRYLNAQTVYLKTGVAMQEEEREVRRVLAQRGMRIVARLADEDFIALGAATRHGEQSAVRIISRRGVVVAEDGDSQHLFNPGQVALIEHFGGTLSGYTLVATARIPLARDHGCVTLHRISPDGRALQSVLDVSALGSAACVVNLAPGRDGRVRATVGWPSLYALTTPVVNLDLDLVEPLPGRPAPERPVLKLVTRGEWLEHERARLSTVPLARASFSRRHAVGVARAALASLAGVQMEQQVATYRAAVHYVPPGSLEAELVAATIAHIERGWQDPESAPPAELGEESERPEAPSDGGEPAPDPDAIVIEPEDVAEP